MMMPKTTFLGLACLIGTSHSSLIRIPHVQTATKPTVVVMPRLGRPLIPTTNIRVVGKPQAQQVNNDVPTTFVRDVVHHGEVCYDETEPLPLHAFNMTAEEVTPTATAFWLPYEDDGYLQAIRASLDAESWDDTSQDADDFLSPSSAPTLTPKVNSKRGWFNGWYCLYVLGAALVTVSVWFVVDPPEWYYYVLTEDNTWEPRVSRAVLEKEYQDQLEYEERVRQQEELDEAARKQRLPQELITPQQHEWYYRATTAPTFLEILRQQPREYTSGGRTLHATPPICLFNNY